MDDLPLARYQNALMKLLVRTDVDDNERMKILREDPAFAPYADYVGTFERRFVALGAAIQRSYARPEPPRHGDGGETSGEAAAEAEIE